MDTSRQILRYSVPGSLYLITVFGTQGALRIAWREDLNQIVASVQAAPAIVGLVASIPAGFVVYQIYHANYRPHRLRGRMATRDRGAEVLEHLSYAQRTELAKTLGSKVDARRATAEISLLWKHEGRAKRWAARALAHFPLQYLGLMRLIDWRTSPCQTSGDPDCSCLPSGQETAPDLKSAYEARWKENWDVVMVCLNVYASDPAMIEVKRTYASHSDIYHALGASRTAIWSGLATLVTYNGLVHPGRFVDHSARSLVVFMLTIVASAAVWVVLHRTRRQTQEALLSRLKRTLRATLPPDGRLDSNANDPGSALFSTHAVNTVRQFHSAPVARNPE